MRAPKATKTPCARTPLLQYLSIAKISIDSLSQVIAIDIANSIAIDL